MSNLFKVTSLFALILTATQVSSLNIKQGHFLLEVGAFNATQGKTQKINIQDLIGDRFNVTNRHDGHALFGLGYLVDGYKQDSFGIDYGINLFYLDKTRVSGTIDQELLFTNLAYSYGVSHLPVYATAKAHINTNSEKLAVTLDAGIGPNFMKTNDYSDWSIDGGVTLPDHAFLSNSQVTLSAMAGIGLKLTNSLNQASLECGYRFFYLGEGDFNPRTNQILNDLKTGNNYANAILCSVTV